MKLTDEQRRAVNGSGNVCLVSCPGSGKTRAIVAKLLLCIEEVRGSTRRIACTTHTNSAADEIDSRVREFCLSGEERYYEVSTIHAFALQRILRPFHRRLPEFRNGFQILTSDDNAYVEKRRQLAAKYRIQSQRIDDFDNIQRTPEGRLLFPDGFAEDAASEWVSWFDNSGFVTLNGIVYHSCRLIEKHNFIGSALASRYAWLLVDEFQDSSLGQVFLLTKIHAFGRTQFFCVGDPNQSIYAFAGATPTLLSDFAKHVSAVENFRLSGNFRSSAEIVELAERLIPTKPPMRAVGEYRGVEVTPALHNSRNPLEGIVSVFLPAAETLGVSYGQIAVLAPSWVTLFHLARGLRQIGYPVIGPGARPYKRDNVFSRIAEAVGAYLESPEPEIALAVQRALFFTLTELAGEPVRAIYTYEGRVVICELLSHASSTRQETDDAGRWLETAAERFSSVLVRAQLLSAAQKHILVESAAKMRNEMSRHASGLALSVEDLGIFARPRNCIHLLTIHKAKGREYDAVAVVDAHDGRIPNFRVKEIPDATRRQAAYEESRRVMYVATTRAKRLLMYFADQTHYRNRPSPFLVEMGLA